MNIKLTHLAGATLAFLAAAAVLPTEVRAQSVEAPQTIPDAMDEILSDQSGTFYRNRTFGRQLGNMFGFGFPEREIVADSANLSREFDALMRYQNTSGPTIRVPDLATPYTASLLTLPSSQAPTLGTEFIFEPF
jgi:hypothetical protein